MRFPLLSCVAIAALGLTVGRGFGDDTTQPPGPPAAEQGAQQDGRDHRAADLQQQVGGLQRLVAQVRLQVAQHKSRKAPTANSGAPQGVHDAPDQRAADLQRQDSELHGELQPLIAQLEQQLQLEMRIPPASDAAEQRELQAARDALEHAIADLRQQDGELQALIAGHGQTIGQGEERKAEAASTLGEQQVARDSPPEHADTLPQADTLPRIADLQRQNDALQHQLAEQKKELAQSAEALTQLTQDLDAARAEVKRLGDGIETFRRQREAAQQRPAPPTRSMPVRQPPPTAQPTLQQPAQPTVVPPAATEQLQTALQWLSGGRPDEARRVLVVAQTQMVFQPVTPDQPVAQGRSRPATDVGEAIRWLDIGATGQAIQSITRAIQSSAGDGGRVRTWSGYPTNTP